MIKMIKLMNMIKLVNMMKMIKLMKDNFINFINPPAGGDSSSEAIYPSSGFTLIETLIAAVILSTVLLGPVTFLSIGLARNDTAEDKLTGLYLAQEGIELVRRIRENNILADNPWNQGLAAGNYQIDYNDSGLAADSGSFLRYDSSNGIYSYNAGSASKYTRRITLSDLGTDQLKVVSLVQWTDRFGRSRSVRLEEVLYNWL